MATSETKKLQETIDELKERVERLEKENAKLKGKTGWEPKNGEVYYALDGGKISDYINFHQCIADDAIAAGNCFKTRDEAEEFLTWLKARKTLLDDTNDFKPDWECNSQRKFYVYYDTDDETFNTYSLTSNHDGQIIWFETEKEAKESIEKHEKEWRIFMSLPAKKDSDDK